MSEQSRLRTFLSRVDLDAQVAIWARKSRLSNENLKDHALQMAVKMLERECNQDVDAPYFPDQKAFLNYWYVATVRSVYASFRQHGRQQELLQHEAKTTQQQTTAKEDGFLAGDWLRKALETELRPHVSTNAYKDCEQLVEVVLSAPQTFLLRRASGKEEGKMTFHYVELANTLGWSRVKLYKRCNQLKEALLLFSEEGNADHD